MNWDHCIHTLGTYILENAFQRQIAFHLRAFKWHSVAGVYYNLFGHFSTGGHLSGTQFFHCCCQNNSVLSFHTPLSSFTFLITSLE